MVAFQAHRRSLVDSANRMTWLYHQLKPKPRTFIFPQWIQAKGKLTSLYIQSYMYIYFAGPNYKSAGCQDLPSAFENHIAVCFPGFRKMKIISYKV